MHTKTLKKLALALTFWLALHLSALRAQFVGPYGTSPITFEVDSNGLLSATGTYGGTGSLSLSGAGTRMLWYPQKAAFRAGAVTGTSWDNAHIGAFSTAFGLATTASGKYSTAFGDNSTASGAYATAFGHNTTASGAYSTASGWYSRATGNFATAWGAESTASGALATVWGSYSTASGDYATAWGVANATGSYATAWGEGTASGDDATAWGVSGANGFYATAWGYGTTASGAYSTASGSYTIASSYGAFVVGFENLGLSETGAAASPGYWVSTDPLFEVGNGANTTFMAGVQGNPAESGPSDAFVVYKNGDVAAQGVITAAPGGDIPMYTGE